MGISFIPTSDFSTIENIFRHTEASNNPSFHQNAGIRNSYTKDKKHYKINFPSKKHSLLQCYFCLPNPCRSGNYQKITLTDQLPDLFQLFLSMQNVLFKSVAIPLDALLYSSTKVWTETICPVSKGNLLNTHGPNPYVADATLIPRNQACKLLT